MKKIPVIARKYLPTRPITIFHHVTIVTVLHYWQAPGWAWGVVGTVFGIVTVASWWLWWIEVEVAPSELGSKGANP